MEFSRRWVVIFVLVVVLLVGLVEMNVDSDEFGITGNVVGVYSPTNCENSELSLAWGDIFIESSDDVVFFVNDSIIVGTCPGFLGYKIDGNETWGFVFRRDTDSFGKVSDFYWASYSNLSHEWASAVSNIDGFSNPDIETLTSILSSLDAAQNRSSILTIDDSSAEFAARFSVEVGSWVEKTNYFEFEEEDASPVFNEGSSGVVLSEKDGATYAYVYENLSNYNPPAAPVLITNISNFTFEQNSSWNFAFGFDNHFEYPSDAEFFIDDFGGNNTGGEWINASVDDDEVLFMPANKFLGERRFRVVIRASSGVAFSNYFNVSIVVNVNVAPVLEREFGILSVVDGVNLTVNLKSYFSDPDGDNLTYRTSNSGNIIVGFDGDSMDLSLGENFSNFERFKVYASDGEFEEISNYISVIEGRVNGSAFLVANASANESLTGSDSAPGNDSASDESQQDEGVALWVWIVLGVLGVFVVVGVILYFVFFRGSVVPADGVVSAPVSPGGVGGGQQAPAAPVNPVNDYLTNLNLPKK